MPAAKRKPKPADTGEKAKGMIYGPQGQGKTVLGGTAALDPRTSPMAFIDFESGARSLVGLPGDWEPFPIKEWDDFNSVFNDELNVDNPRWRSAVVDSLSETHIFALLNVITQDAARRKNPDLIEQGDYGTAMVQMRRLVRKFRDLDMHVFFLAGAKDVKDPREGMVKKPSLSGQLADDIPGMMDFVGYLAITDEEDEEGNETGEVIRSLLLNNYPKVRTKARMPWGVEIPDEIDNPTITSILDTLGY
jgi:hypothetical protein